MTHIQNSERKTIQAIWKEDKPEAEDSDTNAQWQRIAFTALIVMALVALFVLGRDVSNYIGSMKSVQGLKLEITDLRVVDDDNPRAYIRFRLRNDSPLEITIERYVFELYVNRQRVGTSFSTYRGTDPNVDPMSYQKASSIDQTLAPGGDLFLEFTLYIYSSQMESVKYAQQSGSMNWRVNTKFTTILPYFREKDFIYLDARFEE